MALSRFRSRGAACAALALSLVAVGRIAATWPVFSQTFDEPFHLAAGMEWWQSGSYTLEALHPPLARIAIAFLPWVHSTPGGAHIGGTLDAMGEGNALLLRGDYPHNLALARAGVLPFFLLAVVCVFGLARKLHGDAAAVCAVLLFTTLPPVLAHAGLATTDMAVTATLAAAVLAFLHWLESPSRWRALLLAVAVAASILSKFSALVFLPVCFLAGVLCTAPARRIRGASLTPQEREAARGARRRQLLLVLAVTAICTWATYRFAAYPLVDPRPPHLSAWLQPVYSTVKSVPLPAPELWRGLSRVAREDFRGRVSYCLGEVRVGGFWYFFLVALLFKTPLPFLALCVGGGIVAAREARRQRDPRLLLAVACACAILCVVLPSRIDIGLRHVLPIFPFLAVAAGYGLAHGFSVLGVTGQVVGRAGWRRIALPALAVVLLSWHLADSVTAHPDYLAWFNGLAGRQPDRILLDSDLDWGQDGLRLRTELQRLGVREFSLAYHGSADLRELGLPPFHPLPPFQPTSGWIAISEFRLKVGGTAAAQIGGYRWLEQYQPAAMAGRSIRIYYIPAQAPGLTRQAR